MVDSNNIKGYLAFVGGSEWMQGCEFDSWLASKVSADEVLVLPTAAAFERPEIAVKTAEEWFSSLGLKAKPLMLLHRQDAFNNDFIQEVKNAKFIYFSGGSPLHLKSVLKSTPILDAIFESIQKPNFVLAGSSAAAMVFGDPMVDPRGGAFTIGLGLLENFSVLPHFNTWSESRIKRSLLFAPPEVLIAGIDERTALIRPPDKKWEYKGAGKVSLFKSGNQVSITDLNL